VAPRSLPCADRRTRGPGAWRRCAAIGLLLVGGVVRIDAQQLVPKREISTGPAPGCEIAPAARLADGRRDNVEARRLASMGQEASLAGDQAAARDAFAKAAELNPTDDRIAYDLGRAHEELADTLKAVAEYCRYLMLSPAGREAGDVRERLPALVPRGAVQRAQEVQVAFRLGVALLGDGRYDQAAREFDKVVRDAPGSSEGYYNRGLARAASGRRPEAIRDLEVYQAAAPTVEERVRVARAIDVLRRPVYSPATALVRGILPGFGQLYTGRSVLGVVALAAVGGAAAMGATQRTTERRVAYVDPNGVPAPYVETTRERPYATTAVAAAGGVTLIAMLEAVIYANRSRRGASIIARGAPAPAGSRGLGARVGPTMDGRGVQVALRF
jgi:tetratricopeptide (TPR) repeat protein